MKNTKTSGKFNNIKSLNKALDLIEFLSFHEHEIGISEISKEMNINLTTVYRLITTLKNRGYIIQNQTNSKYRLGIKLFELGYRTQNTKNLIKTVRPYLEKLSKITDETSNLAILEGKEVVYLDTIKSSEILRTEIEKGTRIPAHCTALGKAILASLHENELNELYKKKDSIIALTRNSIANLDELKSEIKNIKAQGYAIDKEEFKIGINCLACPIFNSDKKAIAAISITGPTTRFSIEEIDKIKVALFDICREISKVL